MPLSIGVNLRVTGHCNQGGRKYMEDMFSVAYQQTSDDKDLEYAFFGIFDGHGGGEAATFAKEHLMDFIVKQKNFWSDKDEDVLRAIKDGYINTHYAMWRELDRWPRTASGLPSTAGTTASIAFIRKGKIFIGHVGDSGIILGYQEDNDPQWKARALTKDHKPESGAEMLRIQDAGGKVVSKSGVPRVVWNRPRIGHKGPVRRSTHIDEIPFLAVARSLGDLWSYNSELDTFVVSPEPDVKVVSVDVKSHRCLIFGTDGLWNMLTPQAAVTIVQSAEKQNEKHLIASQQTGNGTDIQMWINPSKSLVNKALDRWSSTRLRADNTSVVTLMLDPPGPSRSEVILSQKKERVPSPKPILHEQQCQEPPMTKVCERVAPEISVPAEEVAQAHTDIGSVHLESKQPDSSNVELPGDADCKEAVSKSREDKEALGTPPEAVSSSQATTKSSESQNEGIQVAEVSSSDMYESNIENDENESPATSKVETKSNDKVAESNGLPPVKAEESQGNRTISRIAAVKERFSSISNHTTRRSEELKSLRETKSFGDKCSTPLKSEPIGHSTGSKLRRGITTGQSVETRCGLITTRPKQQSLYTREQLKKNRPRNASQQRSSFGGSSGSETSKSFVTTMGLRYKREMKSLSTGGSFVDEGARMMVGSKSVGVKRRHSIVSPNNANGEENRSFQEPSLKRRTRSDDQSSPGDENNPVNQVEEPQINGRVRWPGDKAVIRSQSSQNTIQDRLTSPNSFQRRNLEKKATPVKTIRRPSINVPSRLQVRGSFGLRESVWGDQSKNPRRSSSCGDAKRLPEVTTSPGQRWLRSDTMAATPVKTLRSRNVDIAGHTVSAAQMHQYDLKQTRLSLPAKIRPSSTTSTGGALPTPVKPRTTTATTPSLAAAAAKLKGNASSSGILELNSSSPIVGGGGSLGIAKRVKMPYNPSAVRSLCTRSRIKRLSK